MDFSSDYVSDIIDEIALEGLDGITLQALWVRLSLRPKFIFKPSDHLVRKFLWDIIAKIPVVEFFQLPEERPDFVFSRLQDCMDSAGNCELPADRPCIFPHAAVQDQARGIMGSCASYESRKNITSTTRQLQFDEVLSFGGWMVIVADQDTRLRSLFPPSLNPISELSIETYCSLERIARSRYEGELTQDDNGLKLITKDTKMLYYFRKTLIKKKIIRKQKFFVRTSTHHSVLGSILHLNRFYTPVRGRYDLEAHKLIQLLERAPSKCIPHRLLKGEVSGEFKKLVYKYPKNFESVVVPYKELHPNSKPSEWKLKNGGERSIRILKLISSDLDKDDDDDEEEDDGLIDESCLRIDRSLIRQAYDVLEKAGHKGLNQASLKKALAVPNLVARNISKILMKLNVVKTITIDSGRQRLKQFYCSKFDKMGSTLVEEIEGEKVKFLEAICQSSVLCALQSTGSEGAKETPVSSEALLGSETQDAAGAQPDSEAQMDSKPQLDPETQEASVTQIGSDVQLNSEPQPDSVSHLKQETQDPQVDCTAPSISQEEYAVPSTSYSVEDPMEIDPSAETIRTEIILPKSIVQKEKEGSKGFTEIIWGSDTKDTSSRMIKRASIIVQSLNMHKVIQDIHKVQKIIREIEESEGLKELMDKKTVDRLINKLESDGLLKIIRVNLTGFGKTKTMQFICHPTVNETHSEIQSAIEQAKMKLPIVSAHHIKTKKNLNINPKKLKLKPNMLIGRKYGFKPKFVRMRILHVYLYYLIYGFDGDPNLDQSCKFDLVKKFEFDDSLFDQMSFVYKDELSWKMFVPPLPIHSEFSNGGWCLLSDVLLRLPLCLFVSIINVPYNVPGIMEYLNHPIKRYFLVKDLPSEIQYYFIYMRRYIFCVSEIVSRLGYIGLIQMGPQKLKEKDQVFIYLNRNALLYNTTTSEAGYNHISQDKTYKPIKYYFANIDDVEQYWYDLWNFAMNTDLGIRHSMAGKAVVVENITSKKELVEAIQMKTAEDAITADVGYIPGDQLGAAGIDSDMFVHLKRNWYWAGKKNETSFEDFCYLYPTVKKTSRVFASKASRTDNTVAQEETPPPAAQPPPLKEPPPPKEPAPPKATSVSGALPSTWKSRAPIRKRTRILKQRKRGPRKPYYDQKDKDALSKMVKLRVDWAPSEDNFLLICKVASLYMSPYKRRQIAKNFFVIRELLHSTFPALSKNKTSRACQRRIHYMMKNPFTARSVYLCLEEVKQDPEVHSKFHGAVEKLDKLLKAQGEGIKGCQKEYDKIFVDLSMTLFSKLKTITDPDRQFFDVALPDTLAEFEKKFDTFFPSHLPLIKKLNDATKTVDIMCSVINTVIHSSLCCASEKLSFSNQLFYIYQQYPDKLLRHVMGRCRSMQIISCRKRYMRWKSMGNDCLPLASSPYQLSIRYVYLLQTKYQYSIFSECHDALKTLLDGPSSGPPSKKSRKSIKPVEKPLPEKISSVVEVTLGGQCANIVELFTYGLLSMDIEFPDQIIILDPRLTEKEESYQLIMDRFKEILKVINERNQKNKNEFLSDDEDDDEVDCDKSSKSNERDRDPYLEQFNLKNRTGLANTASRLALYSMRDEPQEQIDSSVQHAHDFFVLNPCKVTIELDRAKTENAIFYKGLKNEVIADIKRFAKFPEAVVENNQIINSLDLDDTNVALELLELIESKRELGASYNDIKAHFGERFDFVETLRILVNDQYILKSGIVSVRFIHNKFAKVWLIKTFYLFRHVREALGPEKTNSAYAISFSKTGQKQKRKPSESEPPKSPPSKKAKPSESMVEGEEEEKSMDIEPSTSRATGGINEIDEDCNNSLSSSSSSPCTVLDKSLDSALPLEGQLVESSGAALDDAKMEDNTNTEDNSKTEDNPPEDPQTRFLMKSSSKRWVALPNDSLLKFNKLNPSEGNLIYVKVRPWIKVDGMLNRRVLDRLLGSVLGHCLTYPGCSVAKAQEKFTPALHPVHTYELLEILEKIKCIKLIELKKSWKCTLFSKRASTTTVPSVGLGNIENTIIEPEPLAVSRMAYFIGEKTYSVDYLAQLSFNSRDGPVV